MKVFYNINAEILNHLLKHESILINILNLFKNESNYENCINFLKDLFLILKNSFDV